LTIVAKTIAARVLDHPTDDASASLSGRMLDEIGTQGAVESEVDVLKSLLTISYVSASLR